MQHCVALKIRPRFLIFVFITSPSHNKLHVLQIIPLALVSNHFIDYKHTLHVFGSNLQRVGMYWVVFVFSQQVNVTRW